MRPLGDRFTHIAIYNGDRGKQTLQNLIMTNDWSKHTTEQCRVDASRDDHKMDLAKSQKGTCSGSVPLSPIGDNEDSSDDEYSSGSSHDGEGADQVESTPYASEKQKKMDPSRGSALHGSIPNQIHEVTADLYHTLSIIVESQHSNPFASARLSRSQVNALATTSASAAQDILVADDIQKNGDDSDIVHIVGEDSNDSANFFYSNQVKDSESTAGVTAAAGGEELTEDWMHLFEHVQYLQDTYQDILNQAVLSGRQTIEGLNTSNIITTQTRLSFAPESIAEAERMTKEIGMHISCLLYSLTLPCDGDNNNDDEYTNLCLSSLLPALSIHILLTFHLLLFLLLLPS
jgi:hypothetical protein